MNDQIFNAIVQELDFLKKNINLGADISNAESKLNYINKKLIELKKNYESNLVINNENKRQILNEVENIGETFFTSNLQPKINESNFEKIKFVELINIDQLLGNTSNFIKKLDDELKVMVDLIKKKSETDNEAFYNYILNINQKITDLGKLSSIIDEKYRNIKSINALYKDYIDDYKNINFVLTGDFFYPNECIENEMILYSKINKDDTEEIIIKDEFNLIKESIRNMNIDTNENIAVLMSNPVTLDKLLLGGSNKVSTINSNQGSFINSRQVSSIDNYYSYILDYMSKLEEVQTKFNVFKNECRKYNIKYVRMFNHILFIVNYLKLVIQNRNKDYQIYNFIGLNTIIYYREIINKINSAIENKTTLGKYFSKYHYINIQILDDFLKFIYENWKEYNNYCTAFTINNDKNSSKIKNVTSKLYLYDNALLSDSKIKKCVFIFNAMKDLLDKFKSLSSPPVAVYLRINKNLTINNNSINTFVKDMNKIGYLDGNSISRCKGNTSKINNIKFAEVFDSESFNDNSVLSKYMSIPTFLSQGTSIMLLTYGYSGVGKTFTVFGTKDHPGMLQTALNNIQQQQGIYFRAYELYGLAFPYKSYWQRNSNDYYHFIYDYTQNYKSPTEISAKDMSNFINKLNNDPTQNNSSFRKIENAEIKNFQQIIDNIDETRTNEGRIKKTKNNPKSSRSIMIIDFKIKLANSGYVNFVIIDLPGKENIKETFIDNNDCIPLYENISPLIRNMAFLSPLSLMMVPGLNDNFIKVFSNLSNDRNFTFTYLGNDYNNQDIQNNRSIGNYKQNIMEGHIDLTGKNNAYGGLELMRHIINNNRFDLLCDFYEEFIFAKPEQIDCYKNKNYSMTPFEGYYINENIIGLLSTLLKNLNLNNKVIEEQKQIFLTEAKNHPDFKNLAVSTSSSDRPGRSYIDSIDNELKAQTYFFRFLSKNSTDKNNFCGKNLNYWINETYDYNKSFNVDNPPIASLLSPYFQYIKNFYLFYVVSNDDPLQCDKQIKLISDSKVFLDELNNYNEQAKYTK